MSGVRTNRTVPILLLGLLLLPTSAEAAVKYWVGGTAGNFNDANRWATASGGTTYTTTPGSADVATFDGGGTASCTITADPNVGGINIKALYTGTIAQNAGVTITLGGSGYSQAGGTVNLADTVNVSGNWTYTAGTVNAGASTVVFQSSVTINSGSMAFNHVSIAPYYGLTVTGTMTVNGNLALVSALGYLDGGTIAVAGNVTTTIPGAAGTLTILLNGTGDQSLGGTGSLPRVSINKPSGILSLQDTVRVSHWTYTAGTVNAGAGTVTLVRNGWDGVVSVNSGSMAFNHVSIEAGYGLTVTGTMTVNGNLALVSADGYLTGGTIAVGGNVTTTIAGRPAGTLTILLNGTGDQSLGGTGALPRVSINKPSGILSLPGTLTLSHWTYTAGTVNPGAGTVAFQSNSWDGVVDINSGSMAFNHVSIDSGYGLTIPGTMTVNGNLALVSANGYLTGGTIAVGGNVTTTIAGDPAGTLTILLNGTADQSLGAAGGTGTLPDVRINKPSGTLSLQDTLVMSGWTSTPGAVNAGASTVVLKRNSWDGRAAVSSGSTVFNHVVIDTYSYPLAVTGTMTANGNLTFTSGAVNNGALEARGNVTVAAGAGGGNAALTFGGSANQTYLDAGGAKTTGAVTINKPLGVVSLASNLTLNAAGQNMTITAGTLDLNGKTLTVNGTLTNDGIILASGAGTPITAGTLTSTSDTSRITYSGNVADGVVNAKGGTYGKLTVDNPGTTFLLNGATTVKGNVSITAGSTLDVSASNYGLTVGGNWSNLGTFVPRAGTVTLNGANQALSGTTSFYKLTKTVSTADILTLPATLVTSVQNTLNLNGASGQLLYLRSATPGMQAKLTLPTGGTTQGLCFMDIKDNDASGGQGLTVNGSVNSGNTLNWIFGTGTCTSPASADGLVANWKLNETSGTSAADATSNANTGTLRNSPTWTTGKFNGGLQFNGSNQDVSIPDSPSLSIVGTGLTLAAWLYPTAGSGGDILHKEGHYTIYRAGDGRISYADSRNWCYDCIGWYGSTSVNTWSHVAATYDGSNVRIYINGTVVATIAQSGSLTDNAYSFYIGSYNGGGSFFPGKIDDVRIYNRALSASEIATVMLGEAQAGTGVLTLKDADTLDPTVTNSTSVTASFTVLEADASAYVLSNTSGSFGATTAIPAKPAFTATWTLSTGDGDKIVHARITKGSGTYDISDLITLDATPPAVPTGLALTANGDNTAITASVTAPASSDVSELVWRYTAVAGNTISPTYPSTSTDGTAFGTGSTTGVTASSSQSITASSLIQLKTYAVAVWAKDRAGNLSTSAAQGYLYLAPPTPRLVISAPSSAAQAGSALTLTLTAKDASGSVITTYAGPYTLTWTPTGGSASTLVSSSSTGWSSGVTTTSVTIGGTSAGPGSFSAVDNSSNALTMGSLAVTFYPASFSVTTSATSLSAGEALTLTVTAKDAAGATVTRYSGSVTLGLTYVAPTSGTKGLSASLLTSFTNGVGSLSLSYPDAGQIAITAKDTSYVSGITIQGTSSTVTLTPAKFLLERLPLLPNLLGPYVAQPFEVRVKAIASDGVSLTPNYSGTVTLTGGAVTLTPTSHTFVPATNQGSVLLSGIRALNRGQMTLTATAGTLTSAETVSTPVREGLLVLDSVTGPLGTLMVSAYIKDVATGFPVPDDYSTRVLLSLSSPTAGSPASSPATASPLTVMRGTLSFPLTKADEGSVTVSASVMGFPMSVQAGTIRWSKSATSSSTTTFNILQFEQSPGTMTFSYPTTTTAPTGSYYPTTSYQSPTGTTTTTAPAGYLFLPPTSTGTTTLTQPAGTFTYGGTKYDAGVSLGYTLVAPSGSAGTSFMSPGSFFNPAASQTTASPGGHFTMPTGAGSFGSFFGPATGSPGASGASPGSFFFGPPSGSRSTAAYTGPMSFGTKGDSGSGFSPWAGHSPSEGGFGPMEGGSAMSPGAYGPAMGPGYGSPPAAMRSKMEGLAQSWKDAGKLTSSQFDAMMQGIETGQAPQGLEGSFSPESAQGMHQEFNALMGQSLGPMEPGSGPRWVPGAEGSLEPPAGGPPAWFLGPVGERNPDGSNPFMVFDPGHGAWQPESGPGGEEEEESAESLLEGEASPDEQPASESPSTSEPSEDAALPAPAETTQPAP